MLNTISRFEILSTNFERVIITEIQKQDPAL